eukprot:TRINITY_DN8198_c0_g1_i1.p1 TRINITY_DN8198_c0_g1~~TRINITY_DN8198_c0_g1_i1.p1  ORF type:complete len:208 (-),score=63.96 TRINITY_DN8198_c0_g1_i1:113-715(-)
MGWGTAFAVSGIWGGVMAAGALTADAAAQVWEVKVPKRRRPRGRDCGFMDCGRTVRFTLLPGLAQGLVEGFSVGWLWSDYFTQSANWPSQYLIGCVVNDCVTTFVLYPLAFRVHRRPMKQNFLIAVAAAQTPRILVQVLCGVLRSHFLFSWLLGTWLPYLLFSALMYRGAYPEDASAAGPAAADSIDRFAGTTAKALDPI